MSDEQLYDISSLKAISRGNDAFVKKMLNIFCEQTPVMLKEMLEAHHASDFEKMGNLAHKIKPSIDNLNIVPIRQYIRDIEASGRDNVKDPSLVEKLSTVKQVLNTVLEQIRTEYPDNN